MVPELSFLSVYLISRLGGMLGRRCRTDEAKEGVAETVTFSASGRYPISRPPPEASPSHKANRGQAW